MAQKVLHIERSDTNPSSMLHVVIKGFSLTFFSECWTLISALTSTTFPTPSKTPTSVTRRHPTVSQSSAEALKPEATSASASRATSILSKTPLHTLTVSCWRLNSSTWSKTGRRGSTCWNVDWHRRQSTVLIPSPSLCQFYSSFLEFRSSGDDKSPIG